MSAYSAPSTVNTTQCPILSIVIPTSNLFKVPSLQAQGEMDSMQSTSEFEEVVQEDEDWIILDNADTLPPQLAKRSSPFKKEPWFTFVSQATHSPSHSSTQQNHIPHSITSPAQKSLPVSEVTTTLIPRERSHESDLKGSAAESATSGSSEGYWNTSWEWWKEILWAKTGELECKKKWSRKDWSKWPRARSGQKKLASRLAMTAVVKIWDEASQEGGGWVKRSTQLKKRTKNHQSRNRVALVPGPKFHWMACNNPYSCKYHYHY
ncbi:hypothetical protein H4582DRAFT_2061149 [Lactarius indigo]|nr:hypothetical protein H4582DRAFT_2061149 [Lactarius indigo]